jgi:hypothetical protein
MVLKLIRQLAKSKLRQKVRQKAKVTLVQKMASLLLEDASKTTELDPGPD